MIRYRFIFVFILVSTSTWAVEPRAALFWQVQQGEQRGWVLGSVHFADDSFYPMPAAVEEAFAQAEMLAVEVDISDIPAGFAMQMVARGTYTGEETLQQHLSAETWALLTQYLQEKGVPIQAVQKQKPPLLMMTLGSMQLLSMGLSPEQGVDLHFLRRAKALDKTVYELESMQSQLDMLFSLPDQDALLRDSLESLQREEKQLEQLLQAWRSGDEAYFYEQMIARPLRENPGYRAIYEIVFFERNRAMAEKMIGQMRQGHSVFTVVGAGHVVGAGGVVDLLQQAGYRVTAYTANRAE